MFLYSLSCLFIAWIRSSQTWARYQLVGLLDFCLCICIYGCVLRTAPEFISPNQVYFYLLSWEQGHWRREEAYILIMPLIYTKSLDCQKLLALMEHSVVLSYPPATSQAFFWPKGMSNAGFLPVQAKNIYTYNKYTLYCILFVYTAEENGFTRDFPPTIYVSTSF